MSQTITRKIRMELDPVGQFYAATINERQPGNFYITAYLKEPIDVQSLQTAVNDLMCRMPFLSGRLHSGFFWYFHEMLAKPPQIVFAKDMPLFDSYYKHGDGHVLRVLYGERHFTVEAIHSVVDGRGLAKVISILLVRYFELLGLKVENADIADNNSVPQFEETEDAYCRYADFKNNPPKPKKTEPGKPIYRHKGAKKIPKKSPARIIKKTFDAEKFKAKAQTYGATISEYILTHIFKAIAEERNENGCKRQITSMIPIDCRNFFPSRTFRSFVVTKIIIMPEVAEFSDILQKLRGQFTEINSEFTQAEINQMQRLKKNVRFLPLIIKKWMLKWIERLNGHKQTTIFSNLGRVTLPHKIQEHIENLEFTLSSPEHIPYSFACITSGQALTLTITAGVEGDTLANKILTNLQEGI